jgi:hypothetical protein
MFTAALFIITQNWKPLKCPLMIKLAIDVIVWILNAPQRFYVEDLVPSAAVFRGGTLEVIVS